MEISGTALKIAGGVGATTAVVVPTSVGIAYATGGEDSIESEGKLEVAKEKDASNPTHRSEETEEQKRLREEKEAKQKQEQQEEEEIQKINNKLKELGINSDCNFAKQERSKECKLDQVKIKQVNFLDRGSGGDLQAGTDNNLKIERISKNDYPNNLKFIFTAAGKSVKATSVGSGGKIIFRKNEQTEFKINKDGNKLERVWTVEKLGGEVGLSCTSTNKKCTHKPNGTIKIWISNNEKIENATGIKEQSKSLVFETDEDDYSQGFKFTAGEDIALVTADGGEEKKIKAGDYEISKKGETWYLVKKSSN